MRKLFALLAAATLLLGTAAAQSSGASDTGPAPGSPFYFLKQADDAIETAIASAPVVGSPALKAKVHANHAEERLAEARKLAAANRSEAADRAMDRYRQQMNYAQENAKEANITELNDRFRNVTRRHTEVLKQVRERVPEQAKASIDRAIENNEKITGPPQHANNPAERPPSTEKKPDIPAEGPGKGPEVNIEPRTEVVPGKPTGPGKGPEHSSAGETPGLSGDERPGPASPLN